VRESHARLSLQRFAGNFGFCVLIVLDSGGVSTIGGSPRKEMCSCHP